MAYEVGVGYLSLVPSLGNGFSGILQGAGNDIQRTLGGAGGRAGEEAGGLFSGSFGKILKAGAIVAAVAAVGKVAGAAFSSTFGEAMERETSTTKLSAQLGLSDADSKALGASAGKLYAQAYGESFGEVTDAVGVVKSSLKDLDAGQLEAATKKALSFSQAFDVDMSRSVQSVSTLIGSGLVKDSTEAFDLLTKASQEVPAALREDVLDASDEYAQFFKSLGFNGSQAFGALSAASDKGVFGIDKTGDAIKEFTIRATDMSTSTQDAFGSIGLDAQSMANDILAGGDTAQGATQKIVDGLLGIQDPATQANTAIALFGTPLEDLGVSNIPTFLSSLQGATGGLGDFAGAADEVDKKLGSTIQSKFTSLTRTLGSFGPTLSKAFLPVVGPILDGLTGIATRAQASMEKASESITAFIDVVSTGEGYDTIGGPDSIAGRVATSFYGLNERMKGEFIPAFKGNMSEIYGILVKGDFTGVGSFEEDSPIIDFLFTIRETVQEAFGEVFKTLQEVWKELGPPLMEAFKTIWEALKPLIPTFLELFQAFNPIGLLFKALLPVLPQLAGVFGELAKTLAGGIARTLEALAPLFQKIVDVINRLLPFVTKLITSLLPPLVSLFEKIAPLLDAVLDALLPLITNIIDALIPAIDALMPVVERVFTFFADSIGNVINLFSGIIDFITGVFSGNWELAWNGIKEIFGAIWDQFKNIVSLAWDGIQVILNAVWEKAIKPVFDAVSSGAQSVGSFFSGLWDTVEDVWNWISDKIGTVWNWIDENVFSPLKSGIDTVGQFFSDLWGTVQNVWNWIQDKVSTVWNWINQNVFAPLNLGINTIATFMGNLWLTVQDVWGKISGFFSNVAEGVSSAVDTVRGAIEEVKKLIENFVTGEWVTGSTKLGNLDVGNGLGFGGGGARGAVVPGRDPGRRDNVLGMLPNGLFFGLRSEEAVMVPEFTHAVGGEEGVNRLNRLAEAGLIGEMMARDGYARGGVVGKRFHDMISDPALQFLGKAKEEIDRVLSGGGGASNGQWGPGTDGSGLAANTQAAKNFIMQKWGISNIGGVYGGSVPGSDHPIGKALDVMIANYLSAAGIAQGTSVADWFIQNPNAYGTKYVIWRDRINQNGQWAPYQHPSGSNDTLQHRDHVHLSFLTGSGQFAGGTAPADDKGTGILGNLVKKITEKLGFSPNASANPGGSGVERWRPLGLQVLAKVGSYVGKNLTPFIENMMNQIRTESGGDPNAINNYDINAQRGDPSIGLLQVIGSTFRAALRGTPFEYLIARGQRDPEASLTSSTLYSLNRYGSLDRAWRGVAYANGGITPDWGGGRDSVPAFLTPGEGVFTPPQTSAIITHAKALEAGWSGQVPTLVINLDSSDPLQVAVGQMIEAGVSSAGRELIDAIRVDRGLG